MTASTTPAAHTFPREFQRNILRLLLNDREVLASYRAAIEPGFFTDESYRWIVECALKVFDAAGAMPSRASLQEAAIDGCPGGLDPDEIETEIGALYEDGVPEDSGYVVERIITFAKHQRLRAAASEAEEMLAQGKYDEWVDSINAAAAIGVEALCEDLEYDEDSIDGLDRTYEGAVPTLLGGEAIDQHLDGGGLCRGELGLFLGLPGFHKTTALVGVGKGALERGLKVAHFTFEVSAVKLATRYNSVLTGMTKLEMLLNRKDAKARINAWLKQTGGSLRLSYAPENTMTLAALEARLKLWQVRHGWTPDLLLVDYGALLKPSHDYEGVLRFQHAELYNGLRRVAGVWKIPVWTAQQSGREGEKAMRAGGVISMMNAAEAFEPIRRADIVISLNQTAEEQSDGIMRLHGAKVREGQGGFTETLRIDAARFTFAPLIDDTPPPPPPEEPVAPPPRSRSKRYTRKKKGARRA